MEKDIQLMQEKLEQHEIRIQKLEIALSASQEKENHQATPSKKLSLKEFLREIKPVSIVQKVLSVGYYLEVHQECPSFNIDDIKRAFMAAKEPPPSNIAAFINQNISNAHIMLAETTKGKLRSYVLTTSGENFIDSHFGSEGPKENK
jgi:hypothetical protein